MKHARLAASAAHRWFSCPGCPKEGGPTTFPAAEGTAMHDLASNALKRREKVPALVQTRIVEGHTIPFDDEMVAAVQFYVDTVNEDFQKGDELWIEMPLHDALKEIDMDLGGTADAVRYRPSTQHLRVFDAKFGSGTYVDVEANKQELIYCLGVILALRDRRVKDVTLTIVQPRYECAVPERDWHFKAHEIIEFIADVQDAAARTRQKKPPLVAGEHCKFCPAAKDCPELEKRQHALVAKEFDTLPSVAPAELAKALAAIPLVKERIKAIEEYAYDQANRGIEIPGYKLVDKEARRYWKSEGDVIEWAQEQKIDPYASRDVLSPAQLEKKIAADAPKGKKKEAIKVIAHLYESKSSGTVLVPAADDRPPAKRITADDFAVLGTTADKKEAIPVSLF